MASASLQVKYNFEKAGGKVWEFAAAEGADIHSNGCVLSLPGKDGGKPNRLTGRLLIDCMGNASPIVRQVGGCLHPYESPSAYIS